jgi:hypothetical protein
MYAGEGFWRQCRLRRFILRLDGFVSVHAPLAGGELVTKPLMLSGKELTLNLATSAAGSIQVELQTVTGKPFEGFSLADCPEIFGDEIERVVQWRKGRDVGTLAGKPIRLRMMIRDADLYSFKVR